MVTPPTTVTRELKWNRATDPRQARTPVLPRRQPVAWIDLSGLGTEIAAVPVRLEPMFLRGPRNSLRAFVGMDCAQCSTCMVEDVGTELVTAGRLDQLWADLVEHARTRGCGLLVQP